jgi:hypothetical protein
MTTFRTALASCLAAAAPSLPPVTDYRGLVVVAGGELYGRLAWNLITTLRGLRCTLPVELWHFSHEMPEPMRSVFTSEPGVRLVDVGQYCREHGIATRSVARSPQHAGWWLKSFALRHCGFAEVMLLDADNVPAVDPTYLFHDTAYERAGAMFWPDLPPSRERGQWVPEGAWRAVGLEPVPTARPFESGQILVNRRRHLHALDVALVLNDHSEEVYQFVYGDKDTFLLAWHLCGQRYHMPPKNPAWRHPAICQHDSNGNLVFQHACAAKAELARGEVVPGIVNRRFAPDAAAEFDRRAAAALARWTPHVA